jgi:hypothetical protein
MALIDPSKNTASNLPALLWILRLHAELNPRGCRPSYLDHEEDETMKSDADRSLLVRQHLQ